MNGLVQIKRVCLYILIKNEKNLYYYNKLIIMEVIYIFKSNQKNHINDCYKLFLHMCPVTTIIEHTDNYYFDKSDANEFHITVSNTDDNIKITVKLVDDSDVLRFNYLYELEEKIKYWSGEYLREKLHFYDDKDIKYVIANTNDDTSIFTEEEWLNLIKGPFTIYDTEDLEDEGQLIYIKPFVDCPYIDDIKDIKYTIYNKDEIKRIYSKNMPKNGLRRWLLQNRLKHPIYL